MFVCVCVCVCVCVRFYVYGFVPVCLWLFGYMDIIRVNMWERYVRVYLKWFWHILKIYSERGILWSFLIISKVTFRELLSGLLITIIRCLKILDSTLTHFDSLSGFANGPADLGLIPGRVIPKTKKWYLIPPCLTLSIIRYVSRVKWINPGKGVVPSPTPWCSSYRKGSLRGHPRLKGDSFTLLTCSLILLSRLDANQVEYLEQD